MLLIHWMKKSLKRHLKECLCKESVDMVKGIHHVALRCLNLDNYNQTLDFYVNVIGMNVKHSWGSGDFAATMLELNGGIIEIFSTGKASNEIGTINHFAFECDDVFESVKKVQEAGYQIIVPPTMVNLKLNKPSEMDFPLIYAYCVGPVGEIIEFYKEK